MFPYRRQGPKKRKNGPPRNKVRGPQKGLPNSARDLLPILQSATKALAQMLAGRTRSSGQLGHAESTLAQAERLIGERAHNRLNPAEREEFFEQLARLKLTLADAAAEAEAQAAEDQQAKPPARQVAQERLKEMALSLSQPERHAGPAPTGANGGAPPAEPATGDAPPRQAEPEPVDTPPSESANGPRAEPTRSEASGRPGRLQLPRASAEAAATAVATGVGPSVRRRSRPAAPRETSASSGRQGRASGEDDGGSDGPPAAPGQRPEQGADAQEAGHKEHRRLRKPKHKGVPEGWVIDEEGFVVPGTT